MSGQAVRLEDAVVLTGRAIAAARYAVEVTRSVRAGAGRPPLDDLERLADVLAPRPGRDLDPEPDRQGKYMTTTQAAERLGVSPRHARRLAARLDAQLIGGRLLYPTAAVAQHHEGSTLS